MAYQIKKHPMFEDLYEASYELQVRLVPRIWNNADYLELDEDKALYAEPKMITLTLNSRFVDKANAEQVAKYVEQQVRNVWVQAVAAFGRKYSDLLIENILPILEAMLADKDWTPDQGVSEDWADKARKTL